MYATELESIHKIILGQSMNISIDLKEADNGTGSVIRNRFGEVQGKKQLSIKKKIHTNKVSQRLKNR